MRRFFISLFLMLGVIATHGTTFVVDGIKYDTDVSHENLLSGNKSTDNVAVLGLENPTYSGDLIIPEQVTYNQKSYTVRYIQYSAFENCTGLTSVTLPNTLLRIDYYAFRQCI